MKLFGQDITVLQNQVSALVLNLLSWYGSWFPFLFPAKRLPIKDGGHRCVIIRGPGGLDKLEISQLQNADNSDQVTVGYNVPAFKGPLVNLSATEGKLDDLVVVKIHYFSINYADICIRWGLYESALRYVGWPIVPGFDFSGEVEIAGPNTTFQKGDKVFGFTLFGAYSSRLLVPSSQIRKVPTGPPRSPFTMESAAALPAVAATALHAVALAGGWPNPLISRNKAALVHSAAGGVGCMLLQILKIQGFYPIVAVVGRAHKRDFCMSLGADFVIDKSSTKDMWKEALKYSPDGFAAVFDANGVETLQASFDNLSRCGRLVTYGFHSNLPRSSLLSPWNWIQMIWSMAQMPKFDPMQMCMDSKTVAGFNLSFFADEKQLIETYLVQIVEWINNGQITVQDAKVFDIQDIGKAHELIQSGSSVGKIIIKASY